MIRVDGMFLHGDRNGAAVWLGISAIDRELKKRGFELVCIGAYSDDFAWEAGLACY